MKTTNTPGDNTSTKSTSTSKNGNQNTSNPKKPGNDPDQTPDREVKEVPKANPKVKEPGQKNKIGFKK